MHRSKVSKELVEFLGYVIFWIHTAEATFKSGNSVLQCNPNQGYTFLCSLTSTDSKGCRSA